MAIYSFFLLKKRVHVHVWFVRRMPHINMLLHCCNKNFGALYIIYDLIQTTTTTKMNWCFQCILYVLCATSHYSLFQYSGILHCLLITQEMCVLHKIIYELLLSSLRKKETRMLTFNNIRIRKIMTDYVLFLNYETDCYFESKLSQHMCTNVFIFFYWYSWAYSMFYWYTVN